MKILRLLLHSVAILFSASSTAQITNTTITSEPSSSPTSQPTGLPQSVIDALNYERTSWAHGSVKDDSFYSVPNGTAHFSPGTLIKLQEDANSTAYTLPPNTAISRFIYQSKNLNGDLVPVSGYILWPLSPRKQSDGYQVVAWAHGTVGVAAECAPSHFRNLWQHFLAPYQLALQGYVVVATDYAGLGVSSDSTGKSIVHEYMASPAAANDVIYSVQAARQAFPQLSKEFVVVGHSQGGGAAWGVAQKRTYDEIDGYLGAVAVSPVTNLLADPDPIGTIIGAAMGPGTAAAIPDFKLTDIFTNEGLEALETILKLEGCSVPSQELFLGPALAGNLLKPDWRSNTGVLKYNSLTANGGRKISAPLLVIHGENDQLVNFQVTVDAVNNTTSLYPQSQLEFLRLPNTSHIAALTGSQPVWMDWVADRFAGLEVKFFNKTSICTAQHARPITAYSPDLNWFVGLATQPYETP
jgi:pimeloyl-ACP methyl ester carboxylesterase